MSKNNQVNPRIVHKVAEGSDKKGAGFSTTTNEGSKEGGSGKVTWSQGEKTDSNGDKGK